MRLSSAYEPLCPSPPTPLLSSYSSPPTPLRVPYGQALALDAMLSTPPLTLVHHDARPDNMFFGALGSGATEAVLFDWQTLGKGKGGIDLASLLVTNFVPGQPGALETQRALVELYR